MILDRIDIGIGRLSKRAFQATAGEAAVDSGQATDSDQEKVHREQQTLLRIVGDKKKPPPGVDEELRQAVDAGLVKHTDSGVKLTPLGKYALKDATRELAQ
jgi:hypothetical protein